MSRLLRTLLAGVVLIALLGAPILYLLPPDPVVQAPFVPIVVVVAGVLSYLYVYRGGPDERRSVTGSGPRRED